MTTRIMAAATSTRSQAGGRGGRAGVGKAAAVGDSSKASTAKKAAPRRTKNLGYGKPSASLKKATAAKKGAEAKGKGRAAQKQAGKTAGAKKGVSGDEQAGKPSSTTSQSMAVKPSASLSEAQKSSAAKESAPSSSVIVGPSASASAKRTSSAATGKVATGRHPKNRAKSAPNRRRQETPPMPSELLQGREKVAAFEESIEKRIQVLSSDLTKGIQVATAAKEKFSKALSKKRKAVDAAGVQRNGEDDSSLLVSEVDGVSRFVASLGQKVKSVKEEVSKLHGSAMDEFKSKVAAACQELHGRLDEISNQAMA